MRWKYRYSVLALCSLVFGLYHAGRQIMPPALPLMKDEFALSYAQTGFLGAAYDIGYGLTLILGGLAADRVRKVPMIFAGLVLLSVSLMLTPQATSFTSIAIVRILSGAAFGSYFAAGVSLISSYFPKKTRGTAMGIHAGIGSGSGKLLAPLLAGLLLASIGWKPLYYFVGVPVLLTAFVFWRMVKEPENDEEKRTPSLREAFVGVFGSRFLALIGVTDGLVIACALTLYSFLPLYMVKEMGVDLSHGGYAVALLNGVSIPVVPVLGAMSDRFGRKPVIFVLTVCGAISLYCFPLLKGGLEIWLGIVVLGVCASSAFSVIITYVADAAPPSLRSVAIGYVNTYTVIGGVAASVAAGYISDAYGVSYVFPFVAALSGLAAVTILLVNPETVDRMQLAEASSPTP